MACGLVFGPGFDSLGCRRGVEDFEFDAGGSARIDGDGLTLGCPGGEAFGGVEVDLLWCVAGDNTIGAGGEVRDSELFGLVVFRSGSAGLLGTFLRQSPAEVRRRSAYTYWVFRSNFSRVQRY